MSTETASELMTADEFLALPDDGIDRDLIRGVVVERGKADMTRRNRRHTKSEASIAYVLKKWAEGQPTSPGEVHAGEVDASCVVIRTALLELMSSSSCRITRRDRQTPPR